MVGINGTGKSTLLRILAGVDRARRGPGPAGSGLAGGLPRAGARAAPGDGPRRGGRGLGGRGRPRPPGHGRCGRRRRGHPVGWPGQAGGAGPGAGPPGRAPGARRAHQPSRPGRGGLARAPAAVVPWRAGPRDPRPPPARPGHHPDAGARPGSAPTCTRAATRRTSRPRPSARSRRRRPKSTRRNLARRELAWLRRGAQARSRKPQARIDAAVRLIEDRPERSRPGRPSSRLHGDTPRLGDKVIECVGVGFRYDDGPDGPVRCRPRARAAERLGIVGANGTGKSTLVDLLAGTPATHDRHGGGGADGGGRLLRPAGYRARPRRPGSRTWWPAPTARPGRWPTWS